MLSDVQRFEQAHGKRNEWAQWSEQAQTRIAAIESERGDLSAVKSAGNANAGPSP
jgi:hypothetical protein